MVRHRIVWEACEVVADAVLVALNAGAAAGAGSFLPPAMRGTGTGGATCPLSERPRRQYPCG